MEDILLILVLITCIVLITVLRSRFKDNHLSSVMLVLFSLLFIWCFGLLLQKISVFNNINVNPIYFDYFTYIGICLLFPTLLVLSFYYNNIDVKSKIWWIILYIVPVVCLIFLWTNDLHHLFYNVYSTRFTETEYGIIFYINTIYSYILAAIFIIRMISISVSKSGFFTKQTAFIIIGSVIPLLVNMLGTTKIINISIYITPMLFCITLVCYWIAIIKYKALNITPVALETVTNTMSDSFIVISNDGTIVDSNLTYRNTFKDILVPDKDNNFFNMVDSAHVTDSDKLKESIETCRNNEEIVTREGHIVKQEKQFDKYFQIDIHPIKAKKDKNQYIGTLLLFKDITQHKVDMNKLKEKQDIIVKQGQLVSIGELAGGVAHDINTPISAIKTGITILNEKEDREESEKEILHRMDNCATKIVTIVNSMRNQIRNLGGNTNVKFKVSDVINDIKVITYHELTKNKSNLVVNIIDDMAIEGDPAKLGQVLTNLVINASEAYGQNGGKIEIKVEKAPSDMVMIKVADYADGLDPEILPYIFKNILTTKGTFGTGLGLYLAYSVIKGEFNGNITFDTAKGEGTTFYITIPKA